MIDSAKSNSPARFGFLLVNDFTLISMASAIEPLRMANRILGEEVYSWKTLSEDGEPVRASDGLVVNVDTAIDDLGALHDIDIVVVCGGWFIDRNATESVDRWLRVSGQTGVAFGATCTGSYILAKAGLLNGYRCSVHWENIGAMADKFSEVHVSRSIYTIDRDRFTCSGGTSPIDMMLHLIRTRCGPDVSAGVAEQFIYERIRQAGDHQRVPLKHVVGKRSEKLVVAVELMEANIREPMSQYDIARYASLSRRQLQRLFHDYLACGPSRYYQKVRLARARELLHQTNLSLVEISSQTGFRSSSHFSKCFKDHFGRAPSAERKLQMSS